MPTSADLPDIVASEAGLDEVPLAQDLYYSTFGVRLDSRYLLALHDSALSTEQKVQLIHDVIELTDYLVDNLPDSPLRGHLHP